MATKDHCLSLNDNYKNFATSNGQYSNLNLNQNKQCFSENTLISSKCVVTNESRKSASTKSLDTNDSQKKREVFFRDKLIKDLPSDILDVLDVFEKQKENHRKEFGYQERDHIKTNRSIVAVTVYYNENISGDSKNANEKSVIKKNKEEKEKKRKTSKDLFSDSAIKAVFELPQAPPKKKPTTPEVMQFKASQKLVNPNQEPVPTQTPKAPVKKPPQDDAGTVTIDEFELCFQSVVPDNTVTEKSLDDRLNAISIMLLDGKVEWGIKVKKLDELRAILASSKIRLDQFAKNRAWPPALEKGLQELRTKLNRQYSYTLGYFIVNLEVLILDPVLNMLPYILQQIQKSARCTSSCGFILLLLVAKHIHHTRLIKKASEYIIPGSLFAANNSVRAAVYSMFINVFEIWPDSIIKLNIKLLKVIVISGLNDSCGDCREAAKTCYVIVMNKMPKHSQDIFEAIDAKRQKSLMEYISAASSSATATKKGKKEFTVDRETEQEASTTTTGSYSAAAANGISNILLENVQSPRDIFTNQDMKTCTIFKFNSYCRK